MTDTKALDALIEAVARGLPSPTNWRNFSAVPTGDEYNPGPILAHRAYYGDLNAAKALHEALLPGWGCRRRRLAQSWPTRTPRRPRFTRSGRSAGFWRIWRLRKCGISRFRATASLVTRCGLWHDMPMNRITLKRLLERAGFRHIAGWVPNSRAVKMQAEIDKHAGQVEAIKAKFAPRSDDMGQNDG